MYEYLIYSRFYVIIEGVYHREWNIREKYVNALIFENLKKPEMSDRYSSRQGRVGT